jgi:hypothetical protein
MPQLDLYIWSFNILFIFFFFIIIYFYFIYFFLINLARVIFLRYFFFNFFICRLAFIEKYNFIVDLGIFNNVLVVLLKSKIGLYLKFFNIINFFLNFYKFFFFYKYNF